ncbi:MAG: hypothetical protein HRU40_13295 [Saprospiraceae bacterium]|nr:hypothetical protein [Saprospiraceae bacterium]
MSSFDKIKNLFDELYSRNIIRDPISYKSSVFKKMYNQYILSKEIEIICYWGCYSKSTPTESENEFFDVVEELRETINRKLSVDCSIKFIFTDTHALLNDVQVDKIQMYRMNVINIYENEYTQFINMSDIIDNDNTRQINLENIPAHLTSLYNILLSDATIIHGDEKSPIYTSKYIETNLFESAVISNKFSNSFFYHPSISQMNLILPNIPILYGYTGRNKKTKKPWFNTK